MSIHNFKYQHIYEAAAAGDLEELKTMYQAGLPVNVYEQGDWYLSISNAAFGGHLHCLEFLHKNGCALVDENWSSLLPTSLAAKNGHLDCLKYAHENGCDWGSATSYATINGHLDCLKYAHENGCHVEKLTTYYAAVKGNVDCLRYLVENDCPYDIEDEKVISAIKQYQYQLKIIKNNLENYLNNDLVNHIINKFV